MHYTNMVHPALIAASLIAAGSLAMPAFAQISGQSVDFVTDVEFIRGHLENVVENKNAGNVELAAIHASHPVVEVYFLIVGDIEAQDATLAEKLELDLNDILDQAETASASELASMVSEANANFDRAVELVVTSEERSDPAFWAFVMVDLLETAEHEYEEGVGGSELAEPEYQDAKAFIHRAQVIFGNIKTQAPAQGAEELEESFDQLNTLVAQKASADDVGTIITGIKNKLSEAYQIELEGEDSIDEGTGPIGGWEYIDEIKRLLDRSIQEYEAGDFNAAKASAVEAYIDNYEFIEGDIAEDDAKLMGEIEVNMKDELVKMIDDRRPSSEIRAHIEQIKSDLETARAVVTPEFPVAALAASLVVAGTVAYGRLTGFGRRT